MTTEANPSPRLLLTNPKALFALLRDTVKAWQADKASRLAAALAYYTIFSMIPLFVLGVAVLGQLMGRQEARVSIINFIIDRVSPSAAVAIENLTEETPSQEAGTLWLTVVSAVTLILGASGIFAQLQDALNTIWGVQLNPEGGILGLIRNRFFAFSMILVIGFVLVVSLIASAILGYLSLPFVNRIPGSAVLWQLADFALSFTITTVLFALVYKILPNVRIAWNDVTIGAAITALLFTLGKLLIGIYLGRSGVGSAFGAAGSLIVLLIWIYYSAQIFLLGAEFTFVYTNQYGSRIRPTRRSIFVGPPPDWHPAQLPVPASAALPTTRHPWYKTYGLILFGFLLGLIAGAARQISQESEQ